MVLSRRGHQVAGGRIVGPGRLTQHVAGWEER